MGRGRPIENYGKKEQKEWFDNTLPNLHPCTAGIKEEDHTNTHTHARTQARAHTHTHTHTHTHICGRPELVVTQTVDFKIYVCIVLHFILMPGKL